MHYSTLDTAQPGQVRSHRRNYGLKPGLSRLPCSEKGLQQALLTLVAAGNEQLQIVKINMNYYCICTDG